MDKLIQKIKQLGNPTVAGLDPRIEYVPQYIRDKAYETYGKNGKGVGAALLEFNKTLIDALCGVVPAVKPQSAYYEMYGIHGMMALMETITYAKSKGMYVILDVKRNDIGSTAEAYASAYLGKSVIDEETSYQDFDCDSVTVSPYLGTDGIQPFVTECEKNDKDIFVLVKTSNKSSGELQDLVSGSETIYEKMAKLVVGWGESTIGKFGYSAVGAVVGATYPEQAEKLRKLMPQTYFLVPGYGAQGGTAKDVAKSFNKDGLGAIVNSSRAIMCAYKKENYSDEEFGFAAKEEAIRMRDEIMNVL